MSWYAPDKEHEWHDLGSSARVQIPKIYIGVTADQLYGVKRPEGYTDAIVQEYAGHYWLRWLTPGVLEAC